MEGLVIDSEGGESFDLDAHYEARVLTFSRENIKTLKEAGKGYIVRISTPFGYTENLYVTDGESLMPKVMYNWLRLMEEQSVR